MADIPEAGDLAPAFELPTDGDGSVTLAGLRGQTVVLFFYPKDDTSGCTKEAIDFTQLRPEFDKAGAVIIAKVAETKAALLVPPDPY